MKAILPILLPLLLANVLASVGGDLDPGVEVQPGSGPGSPPQRGIGNTLIDDRPPHREISTVIYNPHPSPAKLVPLLKETAPKTLQTLYAKIHPDVELTGIEAIEVAPSGWKYAPDSTNEVAYWPVRIKCTFIFADDKGKTVTQKMGILYHLSADNGRYQADFADLFAVRTEEEWAEKLKQDRDAMQAIQKSKADSLKFACINNLRQLDAAKNMWALEKGKTSADTPSVDDLKPYLSRGKMVVCPAGGSYTIGSINTSPTCTVKGHELP